MRRSTAVLCGAMLAVFVVGAEAGDEAVLTGEWTLDRRASDDPQRVLREGEHGGSGLGSRVARGVTIFGVPVGGLIQRPAGHRGKQAKPQEVKLTFDAKGYVVTPAAVTKGVPVKMEVDLGTVKGCMRTVVIDAFNSRRRSRTGIPPSSSRRPSPARSRSCAA